MFFENRSINLKIKCIAVLTSIIMVCLTQLTVVTTTSNNNNSISGHELDMEPIVATHSITESNNLIKLLKEDVQDCIEEVKYEKYESTTVITDRNVVGDINSNTDLAPMRTVTLSELNKILDYWSNVSGSNAFRGQGQVFIEASKQSGLDPVYLIAHAGLESKWGMSEIAQDKINYFGIGSYDHNPYHGSYTMGSSIEEGIVSGAIWISENYYKNGQTSLYSMRYNNGFHEYCTSDSWVNSITELIITSYNLIN